MMSIEKIANWVAIVVIPVVLFALTPYWTALFADARKLEYWMVEKRSLRDETFGVSSKD